MSRIGNQKNIRLISYYLMGIVFVFCDLGTNVIEKILKIVVIFLHHYNAINNIDLHLKLFK